MRTDPKVKHDGISFLLIDMKTPGVEVRPIRTISGELPFSEVFFTDVKVPKENLVGKLNKGWTIAKRLLQFERNATNTRAPPARRRHAAVERSIAKEYIGTDDKGRIADPDLRQRIVKHMMEFRSLQLMQQRMLDETKAGQGPSEFTSVAKNARARIQQEREELLIEIFGQQGLGWGAAGDQFKPEEIDTTRAFFSQQGHDDLLRHHRSPEQHHRQAHARPVGSSIRSVAGESIMALLTEEQVMLRDSARGWVQANAPVSAFRKMRDSENPLGFDAPTFKSIAEMGWTGVVIPEAYGGSEFGYRSIGVVLEELGRKVVAAPLIGSAVGAASALILGGTEAQKKAWLPKIAEGTAIAALAIDEGPKYAPDKIALAATKKGNGYSLSGNKTFVMEGMAADVFVVAARTSGKAGDDEGHHPVPGAGRCEGIQPQAPLADRFAAATRT